MSLVTVSAVVQADGSFLFPPFGLPPKRSISVNRTITPGQFQVSSNRGGHHCSNLFIFVQIIYDSVFEGLPVVTVSPAWLGLYGPGGGSPLDGAVINEITKVRHD